MKHDYKIIFDENDLNNKRIDINYLFLIFNDCGVGHMGHILGSDNYIIFFNEDKLDLVKKLIRIRRFDNFKIENND